MTKVEDVSLTPNQHQALRQLRKNLFEDFPVEALILYGSVARGEADEESDCDLLVVTSRLLTRPARHEITDMVFEINLRYGTNFSTLVVDRQSWDQGPLSILPLREHILEEGVPL